MNKLIATFVVALFSLGAVSAQAKTVHHPVSASMQAKKVHKAKAHHKVKKAHKAKVAHSLR